MIEVKTAELTGAALDWAVAQVDGVKTIMLQVRSSEHKKPFALAGSIALPLAAEEGYAPSICWHCGGPLVDRFKIEIIRCHDEVHAKVAGKTNAAGYGDTVLVAACRAIVASKLGDTVQVPRELMS
ncbi:phage protein NinX family protein [Pseudomonas capsici]|uniref:phage protein NinX family protein n=1 Tax=Pseudomonas capsici TaxID=2810614 RepID=UPI00384B06AC